MFITTLGVNSTYERPYEWEAYQVESYIKQDKIICSDLLSRSLTDEFLRKDLK